MKIFVETRQKTLREQVDLFLQNAWAGGDRQRAASVLVAEPSIAEASFHAACATGHHAFVASQLATSPALVNTAAGARGWVPILYAAWSCFLRERPSDIAEVIRVLCAHGADANAYWTTQADGARNSALYGAVQANCIEAAIALLEAGANPNDGESLYHACESGRIELLDALAAHGLNAEDVSYCLKHVLDFRWHEGAVWFLAHGADPNAVHPASDETSLHWAIKRNCSRRTIEALLHAGADPNAQTRSGRSAYPRLKGRTACDFALRLGATYLVALLLAHGAVPTDPDPIDHFVYAAAAGDAATTSSLLAQSPELIRQLDNDDWRLVSLVAQSNNWAGVRLMLDLGWPVDAEGWMEATPLTWALCYGNAEAVADLLRRDASLAPRGGYFQTPLHTVLHCQWGSGEHAKCLSQLIDAGIDLPAGLYPTGRAEFDAVLEQVRENVGGTRQIGER